MINLLVILRQMEVIPNTNTINLNDYSNNEHIQRPSSHFDIHNPETNEIIKTSSDV
jgi:hypothetical protein